MDFIRWQQAVGKSSVHQMTYMHCVYNWDLYMCSRINTTKTTQKISVRWVSQLQLTCYIAAEETCQDIKSAHRPSAEEF